jgi:hypothetical protein
MKTSILNKMLVAAVAAAMLVPTAAMAQSSNEGYGGPNNVVAGVGNSGGGGSGPTTEVADVAAAPVETSDAGAALPFTGADLGVLLAAGAILLALGLGLRRLTHRPTNA